MRVDDYFAGFDAVFAVDRDVNILAVGKSRLSWPEYSHLTVVKVGMGVGCAFVLDGHVYRGARGGAGQLSAPRASHEPLHRLELEASGATMRRGMRRRARRGHQRRHRRRRAGPRPARASSSCTPWAPASARRSPTSWGCSIRRP